MKVLQIFAMLFYLVGMFTSCSNEDDNTKKEPEKIAPTPDESKTSFTLLTPDGKILADGEEVVAEYFSFTSGRAIENNEIDNLKVIVWVKNNMDIVQKLTVSKKVLSSNYDAVDALITYCWDICYDAPGLPTSGERSLEAKELCKEFYGTTDKMMTDTPYFDIKIEYTFTNVGNGESQKVIGHYTHEKK